MIEELKENYEKDLIHISIKEKENVFIENDIKVIVFKLKDDKKRMKLIE